MTFKFLTLCCCSLILIVAGCARSHIVDPQAAQETLQKSWTVPQHAIWEIEWAAVPLAGPLTVETWRSGPRYRFEILEAPAPALVGQIFLFDGEQGWQYNRFEPVATLTSNVTSFSPLSDAFDTINQLLEASPQTATQIADPVNFEPAQKTTLAFANGDSLSIWRHAETGLPVRVRMIVNGQDGTLTTRRATRLEDSSLAGLFSVGDWMKTVK